MNFEQSTSAKVDRVPLTGIFNIQLIRKGMVVEEFTVKNSITTEGKNKILDVMFNQDVQITTWYIGLIDNSPAPTLAVGDTMSSHSGWSELTAYDEATRVEWTEGAASSGSITNATALDFTMNATNIAYGIFVTSDSAKSGSAGTLWSTAAFGSTVSVVSSDVLKVTYTVNA